MARFIHVVGVQGSGKSELIRAMARDYEAAGLVCAGQDPDIFESRGQALATSPRADVYFIEYCRMQDVRALPGERVIQLAYAAQEPAHG